MSLAIRDDRQMRALTGVSISQFDILLAVFSETYKALAWQAYQEGLKDGTRKRRPGGGSKGALPTMRDKLLFLLYYLPFDDFFRLFQIRPTPIYGTLLESKPIYGCDENLRQKPNAGMKIILLT